MVSGGSRVPGSQLAGDSRPQAAVSRFAVSRAAMSLAAVSRAAVDMFRQVAGAADCAATTVKTGPGKTEICLPRIATRGNWLPFW